MLFVYIDIHYAVLGEPLPCNPEAETALQPPIWHSECIFSNLFLFPEARFFHRHWLASCEIHVRVLLSLQQPKYHNSATKYNGCSAAWSAFNLKHVVV